MYITTSKKTKTIITIITILAIVCTVLSNMSYIKFQMAFPMYAALSFILCIINLLPYILVIIYINKSYSKSNSAFFMKVILLLYVFCTVLWLCIRFQNHYSIEYLIAYLPEFCQLIVLLIIALGGGNRFSKKSFNITALITGILFYLVFMILLPYGSFGLSWIDPIFLKRVGSIMFYLLLIIIIKNTKSPEEELEILKSRYEKGEITEKEYKLLKEDIISKL